MLDHSLYLHIPFCTHRCAYCDFNTYAGMEDQIPAYVQALCQEIQVVSRESAEPVPVHTIFFGGGTPSLLNIDQIDAILRTIYASYQVSPLAEITLEANPGTVSAAYLRELRALGVNRLSFGMQSANAMELRFLTRQHDLRDVIQAVSWGRQAGFDNLSLDLIFGLPNQTLNTWQNTVHQALALSTEHLSLYSLTVEHGTPLYRWVQRGLVESPDDDIAADMYEWSMEYLAGAGFTQYEISNWARPGPKGALYSSRHNLQYWLNRPYLGFGAGAHGSARGVRTANVNGVAVYIKRMNHPAAGPFPASPANREINPIDRTTAMGETMMVGLRLTRQGVSNAEFQARFGVSLEETYPRQIKQLESQGLLEWVENPDLRLRLTPRGRLFGNRVFREFI